MKKKIFRRKIMLVLLSFVLVLGSFSASIFAAGDLTIREEVREREQQIIENGGHEGRYDPNAPIKWELIIENDGLMTPKYVCINCYWFAYTVCAMEGRMDSTWTHSTLLTRDCKVTLLTSRGAMICPTCRTVWEQYGYHWCWEVHTKCSKGNYDICPMEVS